MQGDTRRSDYSSHSDILVHPMTTVDGTQNQTYHVYPNLSPEGQVLECEYLKRSNCKQMPCFQQVVSPDMLPNWSPTPHVGYSLNSLKGIICGIM